MVVLGAGFTINHTFATSLLAAQLRAMKGWYKHKSLFTEPLVPLKRRFESVAAVCKSSLFWGLVAAPRTSQILEDVDRQALKFARLSAGYRRAPGQEWADFNQATAISLRNELGNRALKWGQDLIQQQGQLVGHCLRQSPDLPEHAVLQWRKFSWSRINSSLPAYTRQMQASS
eukprot:5569521-Amphidinium_carterae.1